MQVILSTLLVATAVGQPVAEFVAPVAPVARTAVGMPYGVNRFAGARVPYGLNRGFNNGAFAGARVPYGFNRGFNNVAFDAAAAQAAAAEAAAAHGWNGMYRNNGWNHAQHAALEAELAAYIEAMEAMSAPAPAPEPQCKDSRAPCDCAAMAGCGWSSTVGECVDESRSTTDCNECSAQDKCVEDASQGNNFNDNNNMMLMYAMMNNNNDPIVQWGDEAFDITTAKDAGGTVITAQSHEPADFNAWYAAEVASKQVVEEDNNDFALMMAMQNMNGGGMNGMSSMLPFLLSNSNSNSNNNNAAPANTLDCSVSATNCNPYFVTQAYTDYAAAQDALVAGNNNNNNDNLMLAMAMGGMNGGGSMGGMNSMMPFLLNNNNNNNNNLALAMAMGGMNGGGSMGGMSNMLPFLLSNN